MAYDVKVGFDISDFDSAARTFASNLMTGADAVRELSIEMLSFNEQQQITQVRFQGMSEAGKQFVAVMKQVQDAHDPSGNSGPVPPATIEGIIRAKTEVKALKGDLTDLGNTQAGERLTLSFAGMVRLFESQVLRAGIRAVINEFTTSISAAAEFSTKIAQLQAISGGAATTTATWTKDLQALATTFGLPQTQVASAAYLALQSGQMKAGESTKFLEEALRLSSATTLTADESIKLLSTTMNAYGLKGAADATRTSEILFKALQGGIFTASEFSGVMGKLSLDARGLGVDLESTAAALDTLAKKGLNAQQSTQVLEALFRSLQKPSKDLQDVFNTLGATNGKAFVDLQGGLGGVLKFFNDAQNQGKDFGDLTNKLTELRAMTDLTGDSFKEFGDNLARISEKSSTLKAASDTVMQSIGKQFQAELAKTANYFETTFGAATAEKILSLGKTFGGGEGLTGIVKTLISAVEIGGGVWLTYQAAMAASAVSAAFATGAVTALTSVQGISTVSTLAQARAWVTATLAARNYSITLAGVASSLGVLAILGLAANVLMSQGGEHRPNEQIGSDASSAEAARQKRTADQSAGNAFNDKAGKTQEEYNQKYEIVLQYSSKVLALANKLKETAVKNAKETAEALQLSGKGWADALSKMVSDLSSKAAEAKENIKKSLKVSEDIPKQASDQVYAQKFKYASNGADGFDQQAQLMQNRIKELLTQGRAEYAKGTTEAVGEARKYFAEVEKLTIALFDRQVEKQKIAAEAEYKAYGYTSKAQAVPQADGSVRLQMTVQTHVIEQKINALARERLDLEEKFRAKELERQKAMEAQALAEKGRLEAIRKYIAEAAAFKVTDDAGKVKPEYAKDPMKAATDFQAITDKLNKVTNPEDVKGQFQFWADLERQKLAVVQSVNTQILAAGADRYQKQIQAEKDAVETMIKNAKAAWGQADEDRKKAEQELAAQLAVIIARGTTAATQYPTLFSKLYASATGDNDKRSLEKERLAASAPQLAAAQQAAQNVQFAQSEYNQADPSEKAAKLDKLTIAVKTLNAAVNEYSRTRLGVGPGGTIGLPGDEKGETLDSRTRAAQEALDKIKNSFQTQSGSEKALDDAANRYKSLGKAISTIPPEFVKAMLTANSAKDAFNGALEKINIDPDGGVVGGLNKMAQKLNEIGDARAKLDMSDVLKKDYDALKALMDLQKGNSGPMIGITQGANTTEVPQGKMFGGPMYLGFGGGPRGSDDRPAWLTRGETVIPAGPSRQFAPLLQSIIGGNIRNPSGTSTNVGDIHVHVQGGNTATQTIRDIAKGLRREIQRGTAGINT